MSEQAATIDVPTPDDIRAAVDRMVTSDVFIRSPQLGAFVRFVVEAVLHGKADRIKAYTIGVEVLRRDIKFDPQLDPIVRVEATRLRRAIERYYAGPGATDRVIIDLPRGSYVPIFRYREIAAARMAPAASALEWLNEFARAQPALSVLIAVSLVAAVVVAGVLLRRHATQSFAGSRPDVAQLPPGNGMPSVYIEPLRITGTQGPGGIAAARLFEKINDAFARFDTINVVYRAPASSPGNPAGAVNPAEPHSDYRLAGVLDYQDVQTNALFRVIDVAQGKVVWSRTFDRIPPSRAQGEAEDFVVVALANALLQSYGAIRSHDRAKHLTSSAGDPRYRCILEAADAIRSNDPATRDRARVCLERLTALDPSFAVGFAFLAITYNREFAQEYGDRVRDPQALDKALKAAQRAIELQPEDSRAYLSLFVVRYNQREFALAFAAAEKSLALNKYDTLAMGEYGGRLIMFGQVEKGLQLMQRAGEYGSIRPNWHYFYLFLGSHLTGNAKLAAQYANQIAAENYVLGLVAKALVAAAAGNDIRKRQAIDRLLVLAPGWRDDPRAELVRHIPDSGIVDRLAKDLAAAGLPRRP